MLIPIIDLIKKSIDLYKKNIVLFLTYAILVATPSVAIALLGNILVAVFNLQPTGFVSILYGIVFFILSIVAYFFSLWFSLAFIKVMANRYEGKDVQKPKEMIISTKHLLFPAFIAGILVALAVLGGLILLIIPGIIFSIWFAFTTYSIVLDEQKDTGALRFSKKLVQGRWWGVFWRILLPSLIFIIVTGILQLPLDFLIDSSNSAIITSLAMILSSLISIVLTPFIVCAQLILYFELKKTKASDIIPPSALEPPKA